METPIAAVNHYGLEHDDRDALNMEFHCWFKNRTFSNTNFRNFRNHFSRIHSGQTVTLNTILQNISRNSFFYQFIPSLVENTQNIPDIASPVQNIPDMPNITSLSIQQFSEEHDYSMIKKLARIAFEFCYAKSFCRTNSELLFSSVLKFIAENNMSKEVILYASQVFSTQQKVDKYFRDNFISFELKQHLVEGVSIYYIDLVSTFHMIFEKTDISSNLMFGKSNSNTLFSFLDGSRKYDSSTVHLAIYFDDFNPLLNALGPASSKHKVTSVYLKILNLDPFFQSKRTFIIPFACFYSKSANFEEAKVNTYNFLVSEVNKLIESGISNSLYNFRVRFFVGDNLACNEVCGMVKSFKASHCCRFCLMSEEETNEIYEEDSNLLRKPGSHEENLEIFEQVKVINKKISHVNGVKGTNLLKNILNFDCESYNFLSCISHDIFEAIVPQMVETTLGRLIKDKFVHCSFDNLLKILNSFKLASKDSSNQFYLKPGITCSASQGRTLIKIVLFALKDLIPENCPICMGLVHLNNIVNIVFAPFFFKSWMPILKREIKSLLKFVRYDLNIQIYPKLHFLTHYPSQIEKNGPMKYFSTDLFESMHKRLKRHILTSANHKDVIKSMYNGLLGEFSFDMTSETLFDAAFLLKKSSDAIFDLIDRSIQEHFNKHSTIKESRLSILIT